MKSFRNIFLFLLLSCGSIILLEKRYNKYINNYDLIFKDIEKHKNEYTDVYIGNSHTIALKNYSTINNAKVLNIATQGQDCFKTYTILKKWLPLLKNVERVYIGLDYEMIGQNLTLTGLPIDDRQLYKYTDTLYNYDLQSKLMAKSTFFRANRDLTFLYSSQKIDTIIKFIPPLSSLNDENCKKRALEHTQIRYKKNLITENLSYLQLTLLVAKNNNKKIIFFNPPKTTCFKQHSNNLHVNFAKLKIDSFFKFNKIVYNDYYNNLSFMDSDFLDFDHLNKIGAAKLVASLNLIK